MKLLISGAQVINSDHILSTSEPIFLDELYCNENDNFLEDCNKGILGIGLTTCSHTEDVWIKCFGMTSL